MWKIGCEKGVMKSLEDVIVDKICDLTNYMLSKIIKPDICVENVREINSKMIHTLKEQYGIEGVILDVDETIRKDLNKIPSCNKKWIESLKGELKIIIVTNGSDKDVEDFFRARDIDYIGFAHKPLKKNFMKACEKMNLPPDKVLVVGDRVFDDIYGGKRNNMRTALVKSVEEDER